MTKDGERRGEGTKERERGVELCLFDTHSAVVFDTIYLALEEMTEGRLIATET